MSNLKQKSIHNHYIINVIDKDGNIKDTATAYNTAYSSNYLKFLYISEVSYKGSSTETRLIEPYPEEVNNNTDYWERNGNPDLIYKNNSYFFRSGYKTIVKFPQASKDGYISTITLSSKGVTISEAPLTDLEGKEIYLHYSAGNAISIHIFIYFEVGVNIEEKNQLFPVTYFQPNYSLYCGCCGTEPELLELKLIRYNHQNKAINDGYMPNFKLDWYGITKCPIPMKDSNGLLMGGVYNYQKFTPKDRYYKNYTPQNCWKGLITALVLPGIGLMDLREFNISVEGVNYTKYFKGSKIKLSDCNPCYIPEEYLPEELTGAKKNLNNSFISLKKSAFYNAPHISVYRYTGIFGSSSEKGEEVPLDEPFFSELVTDSRRRRCMSFSQHVPLTNHYCGAESIIPCSPGSYKDSEDSYHGYQIIYTGELDNKNPENTTYLVASYGVTGEYTIENSSNEFITKTFPYKLEYSFDGNIFYTAIEFTESSMPYRRKNFAEGTIGAPIWRLSSPVSAGLLYKNGTTHSDPRVARAAENQLNGYDPLFIFVGYDSSMPTSEIDKETAERLQKANEAKRNTKTFVYGPHGKEATLGGPEIARLQLTSNKNYFETLAPYLYHPNDSFYLTGKIPETLI